MGAVLTRWYRNTSVCGISHARDSRSAWEAALWVAVSAGAAAFTLLQVSLVFGNYFRYEVNTNLAVVHRNLVRFGCSLQPHCTHIDQRFSTQISVPPPTFGWRRHMVENPCPYERLEARSQSLFLPLLHRVQAEFPAVSVCNSNRIHCGNLRKTLERRVAQRGQDFDPAEEDAASPECDVGGATYELDLLVFLQLTVCTNATDWNQVDYNDTFTCKLSSDVDILKDYYEDYFEDYAAAPQEEGESEGDEEDGLARDVDLLREVIRYLYSTLAMRTRLEIGHQFRDLVRSCTFKTSDCHHERCSRWRRSVVLQYSKTRISASNAWEEQTANLVHFNAV